MTEKLSFVTVVFESEVDLLILQARSMDRYLDPGLLQELVVIDNSARGMRPTHVARLRQEYGKHAEALRVLRPHDIAAVPRSVGWQAQQVLKLAVARLLSTRHYVALDAKNHLVAPVERSFFLSPEGKPRVNAYSYENHPLRRGLERVLRYVGLEPADYVQWFTATVTPFVLETAQVDSLIADVERASGRAFADEFVNADLLEFFLYSAWTVSRGAPLDQHFDLHQVFCPNIWRGDSSTGAVRSAISRAQDEPTPFFSVHRRALARLDDEALALLSEFWTSRSLFPSEPEARDFLQAFRRSFKAGERRRKLREAPAKLRARLTAP